MAAAASRRAASPVGMLRSLAVTATTDQGNSVAQRQCRRHSLRHALLFSAADVDAASRRSASLPITTSFFVAVAVSVTARDLGRRRCRRHLPQVFFAGGRRKRDRFAFPRFREQTRAAAAPRRAASLATPEALRGDGWAGRTTPR